VTINSFQNDRCLFPGPLFFLIYLKIKKSDLFNKIEQNKLSLQELSDAFGELFRNSTGSNSSSINPLYFEAQLLMLYNNNLRKMLFDDMKSNIKSKLENQFYTLAKQLELNKYYSHLSLRDLMNKINLLEQIQLKE